MKVLTNSTGSFLTGDGIADVVMRYGIALANRRHVDVVTIPVIDHAGTEQQADIAIGWHIELAAVTTAYDGAELLDAVTISDIMVKVRAERPARTRAFTHDEVAALQWPPGTQWPTSYGTASD